MIALPKMAIAVRQPWAHVIVHGWKDIENRSWPTRYRGPVCIQASKFDRKNYADDLDGYKDTIAAGIDVPAFGFDDLSFGAIVGVIDIVDCVSVSSSPWFFGPYGFVLAHARPIDPIPVKGKQGFYEWRQRALTPLPIEPSTPAQGMLL